MKIFLAAYGNNAAVIIAADVSGARTVYENTFGAVDKRTSIACRSLPGVSHPGTAHDAEPFVLARIG